MQQPSWAQPLELGHIRQSAIGTGTSPDVYKSDFIGDLEFIKEKLLANHPGVCNTVDATLQCLDAWMRSLVGNSSSSLCFG